MARCDPWPRSQVGIAWITLAHHARVEWRSQGPSSMHPSSKGSQDSHESASGEDTMSVTHAPGADDLSRGCYPRFGPKRRRNATVLRPCSRCVARWRPRFCHAEVGGGPLAMSHTTGGATGMIHRRDRPREPGNRVLRRRESSQVGLACIAHTLCRAVVRPIAQSRYGTLGEVQGRYSRGGWRAGAGDLAQGPRPFVGWAPCQICPIFAAATNGM